MAQIKINVNEQLDGCTYQLAPESKRLLDEHPPDRKPVASLFVSFDDESQSRWKEGNLWQHVAEMLTGRGIDDLKSVGNLVFLDPKSKSVLFDTVAENV